MTTTGTTNFSPALGDLVLEAYSRIQVKPTGLTADHMLQARNSANLLLADWATRPSIPNLWKIALLSIPLVQGVATYAVPNTTIGILDYYVRQFTLGGSPANFAPAFSTTLGSTSVKVNYPAHGFSTGEWLGINVPVALGGLLLQGFYSVTTLVDVNNFTITAQNPATATVNSAGTVPVFTTAAGSTTVSVALANHGLGIGQSFTISVPTLVGGLTLSGGYTVATVPTANSFTFTGPFIAAGNATVAENGGNTQIVAQLPNVDPQDRVIFPISRTEYSAQPDKFQQAFPTVVWFDRLINPTVTLWPVPDGAGPYTLNFYAMTQIQDATVAGGFGLDIPYRFLEAFVAGLAARLARKYAPPLAAELKAEYVEAWQYASQQDTESSNLYIYPGLGGYFN